VDNAYSVAAHWKGGFDEAGLQKWAESLRARLTADRVSLGLVFISPALFSHARAILEILRVHGRIPLLAGCSSAGLIAGEQELEQDAGIVASLFALPGAELKVVHFNQSDVEKSGPGYWHAKTCVHARDSNGWLLFADPFHMDCESLLQSWNEAYTPAPVLGGLASGNMTEHRTQVYLNGEVFEEGGVAVSIGGAVGVVGVISQGCTPIGETWTLTRVEQNLIHEIGNRPAYEVMAETFNALPPEEQKKTRGNLFIGLVVNEYLEEPHRGDFLVRNLIGADPRAGIIAVMALPRAGQTMQFQRRDADAATQDLAEILEHTRESLGGATIYGGCLCCCNGRGRNLFGAPSHDARMVQQVLGPFGMAGFFCNGEIGPVGQKNFLHGYTASLALFVKKG
jgi:small ligand-binding sensory domain FIST